MAHTTRSRRPRTAHTRTSHRASTDDWSLGAGLGEENRNNLFPVLHARGEGRCEALSTPSPIGVCHGREERLLEDGDAPWPTQGDAGLSSPRLAFTKAAVTGNEPAGVGG